MKIVKKSNGNVLITDDSGNIIKRLNPTSHVQWMSDNILEIHSGGITTVYADAVTATQIEPAAEVPFNGDAYDLMLLLTANFFFEVGNILTLDQASPGNTHTGDTNITLLYSVLIPANTISSGDMITHLSRFTKVTGAAASTVRYYFNTSNVLSGATFVGIYTYSTTTTKFFQIQRIGVCEGATTNFINNSSGSNLSTDMTQATAVSSDISINWGVDQYFLISVQNASAADDIKLRLINLKVDKAI